MNKSFKAFVGKEILHIVRDTRTMLIALLVPIVQMLLFGFAISTDVNEIDVIVAAPDMSTEVKARISQIIHNPSFAFKGYVAEPDIDNYLTDNRAVAAIVFSRDYDRTHNVQIVIDASNPTIAQTAAGYLTQALATQPETPTPEVTMLYNPRLESSFNFVPGIMGLIFMLICAMLTSASIVKEKETGTMETLLVSPIRPVMIVFAKMVPYFCLACIDLCVIIIMSRYTLGVPLSGSMTALSVISLIYILLALGLGLLISTIADSQMTALLISGMVLIIPIIMLSGMIFPIENMPAILQEISCIVPARWYIAAMRKIMIEGLGFEYVITELVILTATAATLLSVAVKRFKNRLE